MPSLLPLIPALRSFSHPILPTRQDETDVADNQLGERKADITSALLGDAMLSIADLPGDWSNDVAATGERSLFGASEYHALFIAEMRIRLSRGVTNEHLEQHIGVLPRWAVRHFADELDCAVT